MVNTFKIDVAIVGGGLVGGTLGVALAQQGFFVGVIDRESPEDLLKPDLDGRTTAVSYGSRLIFEKLGIWNKVEHAAEPIFDIRVFERGSPWAVYYNHRDVGGVPFILGLQSLDGAIHGFGRHRTVLRRVSVRPEARGVGSMVAAAVPGATDRAREHVEGDLPHSGTVGVSW